MWLEFLSVVATSAAFAVRATAPRKSPFKGLERWANVALKSVPGKPKALESPTALKAPAQSIAAKGADY